MNNLPSHLAQLAFDPEALLQRARKKGVDFVELFFERVNSTEIRLDDAQIDRAVEGSDLGVGIRLIQGRRTFSAYSNQLEQKPLLHLVDELLARLLKPDDIRKRSTKGKTASAKKVLPRRNDFMLPPVMAHSLAEKMAVVKAARSGALESSKKQKGTLHKPTIKIDYQDHFREVFILNSEGLNLTFESPFHLLSASVILQDGRHLETGYEPLGGAFPFQHLKEVRAHEVGHKARAQAERLLKASSSPTGSMPVVIRSTAGGTLIHEAVGHGLEADVALENLSVYSSRLGKRVASPSVTVIDNPCLPDLGGSYEWDDEGSPARETTLIEKGRVVSFLYDRFSALQEGRTQSTGNGRRESYHARPLPRMSNIYLKPGTEDPDTIISSVKRGLLVEQMGGGEVDTVNGSFVFEVTEAHVIRNGRISEPVRGATLISSALEFMQQDLILGSDLGFAFGICEKDDQEVFVSDAQPTLLIPRITVGGLKKD